MQAAQFSKRQVLAFVILGALLSNFVLQFQHAQRRGYVETVLIEPLNRYGMNHCIWKYLKRTAVFWLLFLFLVFRQSPDWLDKLASVFPYVMIVIVALSVYGVVMRLQTYRVFFMVWTYRAFIVWASSGLAIYCVVRSKRYGQFFSVLLTFLSVDSAALLYEVFAYPMMSGYDMFHSLSVFGLSSQYFALITLIVLAGQHGLVLHWRHILVGFVSLSYSLGWALSPHVFRFPRVGVVVFFIFLMFSLPQSVFKPDR